MLDSNQLFELKKILSQPRNIVIIPHKNPDGDAIGSTLGLSQVLKKMIHQVQIVSPNDFPKFLKFLPEAKKIFIGDYNPKGAEIAIKKADIIFMLDFNEPSRADYLAEHINASSAVKILIDHHQFPQEFDFTYSDTQMPATCEMVWHLIEAMSWDNLVDENIATCLYTGIITDTGNFKFPSVKPSTLETAAKLMKHGTEPHKILDRLDTFTVSRLKLLSPFVESLQLYPEYRTTVFKLSREQLLSEGYQKGDTEGFVNYGLAIENIVFSVFMAEDTQQDLVKISFRSKGDFDCSEVARKYFNGGGHKNASGGKSHDSLEDTVKEFVNLLPEYAEKLENTTV
ncbi:bifunctional oligoribonuclease/PAP phosphatase NrnA [Flavobacteriaceae bacterium Ap0902]|nr:bifunctional oligoribonuclease/PAP phosphatase NrnA [Flavobacteriaceae bacterium Ap0902]